MVKKTASTGDSYSDVDEGRRSVVARQQTPLLRGSGEQQRAALWVACSGVVGCAGAAFASRFLSPVLGTENGLREGCENEVAERSAHERESGDVGRSEDGHRSPATRHNGLVITIILITVVLVAIGFASRYAQAYDVKP